jgi:outer membrane immunogenic protein
MWSWRSTIGVAAILASGCAFAADLPSRAEPAPSATAPPAFTWTGLYVGAALGAKWGGTTWTTTSLFDSNIPPTGIDVSSPRNYDPSNVRGGGYLGYSWQFPSNWVGGVEADLAYANMTVKTAGVPGCAINCGTGQLGPEADSSSVQLGWDASARVRLGYSVTSSLLVYGTSGIAWQNVQTSATCQHSGPDPLCYVLAGNPFATVTDTAIRTGWTIGAGFDTRIYGNWILRAEYRYSYFGAQNNSLNLSLPGDVTTVGNQLRVNTQIATVGLAYKF